MKRGNQTGRIGHQIGVGRSLLCAVAVAVVLTGCAAAAPRSAQTKRIFFEGVEVSIPASWPVIDGAHARNGCSSTFEGQANRAFLGVSYLGVVPCPRVLGNPPPADGVWMQPAGSGPRWGRSTTLPDRQVVYLSTQTHSAVVNVWYHHVSILIGLGTDPTVERKILNSIRYKPAATNTTVLGRCPTADQTPPVMPTPIRLTAPLAVPYDSGGRMQPASSRVQPKIGAVAVWRRFFHSTDGMPVTGALNWAIYLGNYSDFNNASAPTWLIVGHGVRSDYGPCGITVFAPYNAATGHPLGMETIG